MVSASPAAGPTTAEITAIDPAGSFIGFQMGTWSGVVCTAVLSNEAGTLASVLNCRDPVAGEPMRPDSRPERHPGRQDRHLHGHGQASITVAVRESGVVSRSRQSKSSVLVAVERAERSVPSSYSSITSSRRRLGRRRPTPRLDDRMKCTRYCTSSQPSVESRSICANARLVFECRR